MGRNDIYNDESHHERVDSRIMKQIKSSVITYIKNERMNEQPNSKVNTLPTEFLRRIDHQRRGLLEFR